MFIVSIITLFIWSYLYSFSLLHSLDTVLSYHNTLIYDVLESYYITTTPRYFFIPLFIVLYYAVIIGLISLLTTNRYIYMLLFVLLCTLLSIVGVVLVF